MRFNFVERNGGRFDAERLHRVVARVEALGWPVDLHIEADFLLQHADVVRRIPLPVVIDHFGNVHARDGKDQAAFKVLMDLLGEPHVWLKISGADRLMSRAGATRRSCRSPAR